MAGFVNRIEDLSRLYYLYESEETEIAEIFGQRRLGKTALVKKSLEGHDNAVVYQAKQKTTDLQLQQFIDAASDTYPGVRNVIIRLLCSSE